MMKAIAVSVFTLSAVLTYAVAGYDQTRPPAKPESEQLVKGNLTFALDLYGHLRGNDGNLFFSPHSISTALALTYAGARATTAEQMAKVLHFELPAADVPAAFGDLDEMLAGQAARHYELYTANALWSQKGRAFLPAYLDVAQKAFRARLTELDFQHATEEARQTINAWVLKQTRDKIRDLLAPGVLNNMTRLVLTSAIYFKGAWDHPFRKERTRDEIFHISRNQDATVPMMHQKAYFSYLETRDAQLLQLPYVGSELGLVIILPGKTDGLAGLEKTLTAKGLPTQLRDMKETEVDVSVPRFKMTEELQLAHTLSTMGMPLAFSPGQADFSGMDGSGELFLSAVVHKAFVDVNEEGTEAAAATGIGVAATAMRFNQPTFRADHPFLFLIRDTRSGEILFMGRLTHPS